MPKKPVAPFQLSEALLAAFDTNDRINQYLIENLPVYKMKPGQIDRMERLNLAAGPITVTPRGIQMTIGPK